MDLHNAILVALPELCIENKKKPCTPLRNMDPFEIGRILKADEVYELKSTGYVCPICLNEDDSRVVVNQGYQSHSKQQKYIRLHGCAHNFHDKCLRKWIMSGSDTSLKDNCPMCRRLFKRISQSPLKHSFLLKSCNTLPSSNDKAGDSEGQQIETSLLLAQLRLNTSVLNLQRAEHKLETYLNTHMPEYPQINTNTVSTHRRRMGVGTYQHQKINKLRSEMTKGLT